MGVPKLITRLSMPFIRKVLLYIPVLLTLLFLFIPTSATPARTEQTTAVFASSCSNNDPLNPYNNGNQDQCTWWAWERRHQVGQDLSSRSWGNAKDWLAAAQADGYRTGTAPQVGAVVVCQPGACGGAKENGHVAYVEEVYSSTSFRVSEQNWPTACVITYNRTVSTGSGVNFIYFKNSGNIGGLVKISGSEAVVSDADVTFVAGGIEQTTKTDGSGRYLFDFVPAGSARITASRSDIGNGSVNVTVQANASTQAPDILLALV